MFKVLQIVAALLGLSMIFQHDPSTYKIKVRGESDYIMCIRETRECMIWSLFHTGWHRISDERAEEYEAYMDCEYSLFCTPDINKLTPYYPFP